MKVGDYFKINITRDKTRDIIYEAVVITDNQEWASAKIIYPRTIAEKLNKEGVFKIHLKSLNIEVIGNRNENTISSAIYG